MIFEDLERGEGIVAVIFRTLYVSGFSRQIIGGIFEN
jgi:hypothetical protein